MTRQIIGKCYRSGLVRTVTHAYLARLYFSARGRRNAEWYRPDHARSGRERDVMGGSSMMIDTLS